MKKVSSQQTRSVEKIVKHVERSIETQARWTYHERRNINAVRIYELHLEFIHEIMKGKSCHLQTAETSQVNDKIRFVKLELVIKFVTVLSAEHGNS